MEFNNEYELLQEIYRGARMGEESIRLLLPKVDNARFRSDLQTQCRQYQSTASNAEQQMKALGQCPRELCGKEQAMLWMSLQANTLCNRETSHLEEMMIQGSNMGILSLTKVLNSFGDPKANPAQSQQDSQQAPPARNQAIGLARSTILAEEDNINRLKIYLQ